MMKIAADCESCDREFLLSQLVSEPAMTGRCTWCGELLAPGYAAVLSELIRKADTAGSEFVAALKHLSGDWTRFRIQTDSVFGPLKDALAGEERAPASSGRAA